MLNSVQKSIGFRDIIYNLKTEKFFTYQEGDNYTELDIALGGVDSGGTGDRPAAPEVGDLFWDVDLDQLVIWNGSSWEPVGGSAVKVPAGPSTGRPNPAEEGNLYFDTDINTLMVYNSGAWVAAAPDDVAVLTEIVLQDKVTAAEVVLSVRDGALIVTDPFTESVQEIDLGGTTPDPGHLRNVFINGAGRYAVGSNFALNTNGLITLEYINSPGQFFVIDDISAGGFGPGDRQGFGLVRETLVDGTDLDGQPGPLTTGNSGGWSHQYTWYYTGGFPYGWTSYMSLSQTPGGSGGSATGAYSGQTNQRNWWELCGKAGVGRRMRFGIANGTLTQQDGADFTNRLVNQMYVYQEMLDHPEAATLLPSTVINNGAGWYTQSASAGEFENMGQFPNGKDKGYRFRWSTFGNTVLGQLPYLTGVSDNDQITAASGQSHYVVYDVAAADKSAANSVLATGVLGPNNRLYPQGTTIDLLQFEQPYDFPNSTAANVFDLKYTYVGPVQASPLFNTYAINSLEEIIDAGIAVAPLEKLHQGVCEEIRQAVVAYYLIRDFDAVNTGKINVKLFDATQAALGGQLINTYDAVFYTAADDGNPEGDNGEVLFPQALKDAILQKLTLWMATLPDN